MTSGKLTVEDVIKAMEQFDRAHIEPVPKVIIANPSNYEELKKWFSDSEIRIVPSQFIDPNVSFYLMDEDTADRCLEREKRSHASER